MTPENFHLTEGPTIRDALKAQVASETKKRDAEVERAMRADLEKAGIPVTNLKFRGPTYHRQFGGKIGNFEVEASAQKSYIEAAEKKAGVDPDATQRRVRFLCHELSAAGAKRFGTFVRTKYGKAPDAATIRRAHAEWLTLNSSCEC